VQALALYALNCAAVFVVAAVLGLIGPGPGGLPFLAVPVAIYAIMGKRQFCAGLIVSAAVGTACAEFVASVILPAAPTWASPWNAVLNACMAGSGLVLAAGISRCWGYARLAVAVAAPVFVTQAINLAFRWQILQAWFSASVESMRGQLMAPLGEPPDEMTQAILERCQWMSEHWSALILGSMFGTALVGACIAVSFTSLWLRRVLGRPGPVGGFRTFTVPDWLAWAVIVAVALGYVDYRWPGTPVRIVAWNLGLAMAVTYWLNGLSILAYGIYATTIMNARFAGYLTATATLMFFPQALAPFGLFDTWFNFRAKLDKLIEAKRLLDESRKNDE
jgi:uncharacterized protein YybS (DUF2232 family)